MGRANYSQSTWAGGEFSPAVIARDDIEAYGAGAAVMVNFIAYVEGGCAYRAGTMRFADALAPPVENPVLEPYCRLVKFQRSALEGYVLELGHEILRIWDPNIFDTIKDGGGADYEVVTPYSSDQLSRLSWQRQGDVMLVFDVLGELPTIVIQHRGASDWEVKAFDFRDGPWQPYPVTSAGSDITLTVTGNQTVGSVLTLAATADVFEAGHIGALVRLKNSDLTIGHTKWVAYEGKGGDAADPVIPANALREFNGRLYQTSSGGVAGNQSPIHSEGTYSDGSINWTFLHDGAGTAKITAVASPTSATATVVVRTPVITTTTFWQLQRFSGVSGYPSAGVFYQERLHVIGSLRAPMTLDSSAVNDYNANGAGFKPGLGSGLVTDQDAVARTLADKSVDPVVAMLGIDDLYAFTSAGVHRVRGPANEEPITPAGALTRRVRGSYGTQIGTTPELIGEYIVHVETGGHRLRELGPRGEPGRPSILSEHLFKSPITDTVWMPTEDRLWILCADGSLAVCVYDKQQGYSSCSPVRLAGSAVVESMASIRLKDGTERLWLVTRRTNIDSSLARFIEVKAPEVLDAGIANACYLDCAGYFDSNDPASVAPDGSGIPDAGGGGDVITTPPAPEPAPVPAPAPLPDGLPSAPPVELYPPICTGPYGIYKFCDPL